MSVSLADLERLDPAECEREGLFRRMSKHLPYRPLCSIGSLVKRIWDPCSQGIVPYFRFRAFLNVSQWWPEERLLEYQAEQLRALIEYAYRYVPYYTRVFKKLGLQPQDIKAVGDLQKLPVLTRAEVLANYGDLISSQAKISDIYALRTSGSSGNAMTVLRDKRRLYMSSAFNEACYEIVGLNIHEKFVQVRVEPFRLINGTCDHIYEPYHHKLVLSCMPHDDRIIDKYIRLIRDFRPSYLMSPPSFMFRFAEYCRINGRSTNDLFPIFVSFAENLYGFQREAIVAQFSCQVFDLYRFTEKLVYATECEAHQGLHVDVRQGVLEVVDEQGRHVRPADIGRVVCTGFDNLVMPLVRYELGDQASYAQNNCRCGRELPLLSAVHGRRNEVLRLNGRDIYPLALSEHIKMYDLLGECQFVQTSGNEVVLRMTAPEDILLDGQIKGALERLFGGGIVVNIQHVQDITRDNSGKFRFICIENVER